jgi:AmiR/NasT family two-component response regulator
VIGQAKGILMARANVDADAAFELLRKQSQVRNQKLRDLAQQIIDDHGARTSRR